MKRADARKTRCMIIIIPAHAFLVYLVSLLFLNICTYISSKVFCQITSSTLRRNSLLIPVVDLADAKLKHRVIALFGTPYVFICTYYICNVAIFGVQF